MVRVLLLTALLVNLAGCWFVYLPIPSSVATWCAAESVQLGGLVKLPDGRVGRATKIYGRSDACRDEAIPIRVDLEFLKP